MPRHPKRFYRTVETAPASGGVLLLLDGKPARSPAQREFRLPNARLAEAIAEEWRSQGTEMIFPRMALTRLAFTAIDKIAPNRAAAIDQIAAYANADAVCYRAAAPAELAARQRRAWDPLLDWAARELGVGLVSGEGLVHAAQPEASLAKLHALLAGLDDFILAALLAAAELCGSAIIALALLRGHLDAEAAFVAANVDELYQAGKWREDSEALARRTERKENLRRTARFLDFLRDA